MDEAGRDGEETNGREGVVDGRLERSKDEPPDEEPPEEKLRLEELRLEEPLVDELRVAELRAEEPSRDSLWRVTGFRFLDVSKDATGFLSAWLAPKLPRPNDDG